MTPMLRRVAAAAALSAARRTRSARAHRRLRAAPPAPRGSREPPPPIKAPGSKSQGSRGAPRRPRRRLLRARPDGRRARGAHRGRRQLDPNNRADLQLFRPRLRDARRERKGGAEFPARARSSRPRTPRSGTTGAGTCAATTGRASRSRNSSWRSAIRCTRRPEVALINAGSCSAGVRRHRRRRGVLPARAGALARQRARDVQPRAARLSRAAGSTRRAAIRNGWRSCRARARSALPRHVRRAQARRPAGRDRLRRRSCAIATRTRPRPKRSRPGLCE